jgi:hypothetical protein
MKLRRLQRVVFELIRGRKETDSRLIKPNARLSPTERLNIYSESYWARIVDSFSEDYPGLRKLMGARKFEKLANDYLKDCPSISFTLRDLGSRLEQWMRRKRYPLLFINMAQLEWAQIEAFDREERPRLQDLREVRKLHLQPYLQLLKLDYAVDEGSRRQKKIWLAVHRYGGEVCFKRLGPLAFELLTSLRKGKTLEASIPAKVNPTELRDWFANWAQLGWFASPPARKRAKASTSTKTSRPPR